MRKDILIKSLTFNELVRRGVGALADADGKNRLGVLAIARSTKPAAPRMKTSDNKKPMMVKVPPVRIPEEPGAVIPHAGICEGGVGQTTSLP